MGLASHKHPPNNCTFGLDCCQETLLVAQAVFRALEVVRKRDWFAAAGTAVWLYRCC